VQSLFNNLRQESENIAAISEEHAASAEEMLATIEEEDNNIRALNKLMSSIHTTSQDLEKIIKN
jgi:hypothetical protein